MIPAPKIAYAAVGWLWPLRRIADEIKKLSVAGIEGFGLTEMLPQDAHLADYLRQTRVAFVAADWGGSLVELGKIEFEMSEFEETVRKMVQLGGGTVVVGGGRIFKGQEKQNWPTLIKNIHRLGRIAKAHKVRLAFHSTEGTMVFREPEFERFISETDPQLISVAFDTAQIGSAGMNICEKIQKHHSRVIHVHLKDATETNFVELGKGRLPLEDFLRELLGRDYAGWLTIEMDSTPDPIASAQDNVKHLNHLLAKIRQLPVKAI